MKDYVLNRGLSEPKFLLIVDEAHLFAKPPHLERETELTTMARMLRKFGLAIVLVAHNFKDIDDTFLTQAGWRIAMSHSDPRYVNDAEHYFSLRPEEVTWFSRGVRGRTILRRGFEPEEIAKTEQR
jgi:DNA helicase HerA-like ATPase